MNKLLNELSQKAEDYADDTDLPWLTTYTEKLTELIVKECVTALWTDECVYSDLALEEFEKNSAKIEQHFGVEEPPVDNVDRILRTVRTRG